VRTYYDGIPAVIQVGNHQFVERQLVHLWRTDMNVAWKSATNCSRSYHQALAKDHLRPPGWNFGFSLTPAHVYDGFIVLSLLEDHQSRQSTLVVPHDGEQKDRFTMAMRARNALIRLYSQAEIRHFCNLCIRVYKDANGKGMRTHHFLFSHDVLISRSQLKGW
jgi:hypothetical protein